MIEPEKYRLDHEGELVISERWLKWRNAKRMVPEYTVGDVFNYPPYGTVKVRRVFTDPLQQYGVQYLRGDRVRRATIDWEHAPRRQ